MTGSWTTSVFRGLTLVVCSLLVMVLLSGCGGPSVETLVKEQKDITEELANVKGDADKLKAVSAKQAEHAKKLTGLSAAQLKEYTEKVGGGALKIDIKLP